MLTRRHQSKILSKTIFNQTKQICCTAIKRCATGSKRQVGMFSMSVEDLKRNGHGLQCDESHKSTEKYFRLIEELPRPPLSDEHIRVLLNGLIHGRILRFQFLLLGSHCRSIVAHLLLQFITTRLHLALALRDTLVVVLLLHCYCIHAHLVGHLSEAFALRILAIATLGSITYDGLSLPCEIGCLRRSLLDLLGQRCNCLPCFCQLLLHLSTFGRGRNRANHLRKWGGAIGWGVARVVGLEILTAQLGIFGSCTFLGECQLLARLLSQSRLEDDHGGILEHTASRLELVLRGNCGNTCNCSESDQQCGRGHHCAVCKKRQLPH